MPTSQPVPPGLSWRDLSWAQREDMILWNETLALSFQANPDAVIFGARVIKPCDKMPAGAPPVPRGRNAKPAGKSRPPVSPMKRSPTLYARNASERRASTPVRRSWSTMTTHERRNLDRHAPATAAKLRAKPNVVALVPSLQLQP